MMRRFPLLGRLCVFVILPIAVLAAAAWWSLRGEWPEPGSTVTVPGPAAPIAIERDAGGMPTVRATTDRDAFFATGYLHAQDRLWQLEVQRRIARGRLSEVLGVQALKGDIWMRTLGLEPAARAAWPVLDPDTREALQAYADGINAWLDTHPRLPIEFTALDVRPERWTPADSLAWAKVFALYLSGNLEREIQYAVAGPMLNAAERDTLFGALPASAPHADLGDRTRLAGILDGPRSLGLSAPNVGSNAWVVAGRLTADHGALLANDPHLGLQAPSLWYAIAQRGHRLQTTGMSLVGLPMVVFGQNGRIAWGGTNLMADTQDLYVEQTNAADPDSYLADGRWVPFERRVERIVVKAPFPALLHGEVKPVEIVVRSTRNGPIVSDVVAPLKQGLALRWTALDTDDTSVQALLRVGYATNWDEFNAALSGYVTPALSFVFADRDGNIGQVGAGRIPLRAAGHGAFPVPGWDASHAWTGHIAHAALPRRYNPPEGYIVSANQNLLPSGYPHFVSSDWAPPSRAERIEMRLTDAIAAAQPFTPAMFRDIQGDLVSLPARRLVRLLLARTQPSSPQRQEALALLARWDGGMGVDSGAATLFNAWVAHLRHRLFAPRLQAALGEPDQKPLLEALIDGVSVEQLVQLLTPPANPWCDAGASERACATLLEKSLVDALDDLRRLAGSAPSDWAWGDVHHAVFAHTPFSQVNVLDRLFERRVATGGSPDTVNVANAELRLGEGYRQSVGAGMRQIIGLRPDRSTHWWLNAPGQSGNVFSRHYDDQLEAFQRLDFSIHASDPAPHPPTLCLRPPTAGPTDGATRCLLPVSAAP